MDDDAHGLGARLRQAREAQGWSQRELARRAGVDAAVINQLETGTRTNPGAQILRRLARVLGVSSDHLLELDRDDSDLEAVEDGVELTPSALNGTR